MTSPCSWLTALTKFGGPERERGHVEQRAAAVVVVAERQEALADGAERAPRAGEVLLDELNGNASCPAGTGVCVVKMVVRRTSSSAASNDQPVLDQIADPLQHDERGVAFVQVPDRG